MAKNIGTLGKYDQRRLWKLICIVNPFDLLLKKIKNKSFLIIFTKGADVFGHIYNLVEKSHKQNIFLVY